MCSTTPSSHHCSCVARHSEFCNYIMLHHVTACYTTSQHVAPRHNMLHHVTTLSSQHCSCVAQLPALLMCSTTLSSQHCSRVARHPAPITTHVACNMMNVQLQTNAVSASFPAFPASFPSFPASYPSFPASYPSFPATFPSFPASYPSFPASFPSFPASFPAFPASFPSFPASFPSFPASYPGHSQPLGMRLQPLRLQFRISCSTQKSTVRLLGYCKWSDTSGGEGLEARSLEIVYSFYVTAQTTLAFPTFVLLQVTIICPYVVTCLATSNNNLPLRGDLSCYR